MSVLAPNIEFSRVASDEQIERTVQALGANNFHTVVVNDRDEAREAVLALLPKGAQVHSGASRTLDEIGVTAALQEPADYESLRPRIFQMDRQTQADEIRRLGAAPDYMVGSVHAVTEAGQLVAASASGSQLGPYVSGAGHVVLAVGAQKIVPTLQDALRRIEEYSFPLEDARAQEAYGFHSAVAKILILNREFFPGRVDVVLIKESIGF